MKKAKPLLFSLDPSLKLPLFRQLYEAIKEQLFREILVEGDVLPATRTLAVEIGVSRASVVSAYEQLLTEGYISSVQGAGYRVQPMGNLTINQCSLSDVKRDANHANTQSQNILFDANALDSELFPTHQWAKTISRLCRQEPESMMFSGAQKNNQLLREAICHHVFEYRGIKCEPWQVIITAGSMEALEICIDTLSQVGDTINIEDPCYVPARQCVLKHHRQVHSLAIDDNGALACDLNKESRLAIITPSHQFPLGVTMSAGRRMEFIYWAQRNNGWIIEDDYDSEFRYGGRPIPALAAFDRVGRTIYIGSFSKLFATTQRISYLILPPVLVETFHPTQRYVKASTLPQRVLAEFIFNGEFYKYLRRARKVYAQRRKSLLAYLHNDLSNYGCVKDYKAGTLLVFHLFAGITDIDVVEMAGHSSLSIRALSTFSFGNGDYNGLVMGFTAWDEVELSTGVKKLKAILEQLDIEK